MGVKVGEEVEMNLRELVSERVPGWVLDVEHCDDEAGALVTVRSTPAVAEVGGSVSFRKVWIPAEGPVVWDAEIDGLGYVVGPDGRKLD